MRVILITVLLACLSLPADSVELAPSPTDFVAGQVWAYQTRSHETDSRLYILRVDRADGIPPVFHIALDRLKVGPDSSHSQLDADVDHLPVWEESLRQSVVTLLTTDAELSDEFSQQYLRWSAALNPNPGGPFALPVRDILDLIENSGPENKEFSPNPGTSHE